MSEQLQLPPAALRLQEKVNRLKSEERNVDEFNYGLKAEIQNNPAALKKLLDKMNISSAKQAKDALVNQKLMDKFNIHSQIVSSEIKNEELQHDIDGGEEPDNSPEALETPQEISSTYADDFQARINAETDTSDHLKLHDMAREMVRKNRQEIEQEDNAAVETQNNSRNAEAEVNAEVGSNTYEDLNLLIDDSNIVND